MLTRYAEVVTALRDPGLRISVDEGSHRELRETARALPLPRTDERWAARFSGLPAECDLIADVAEPICLEIAAEVSGLQMPDAHRLSPAARKLFEAEPEAATIELMRHFGNALHVQAFAALCHTFPAFLGNAWLALLEHPDEMARLASNPEILPDAIEELLRYAGPSAVVFRNDIALCLADANRDADAFPEPDRLRLDRRPAGHVAFGAGAHSCAGATLIRQAARPAIAHFAARFAGREVTFHAEPAESLRLRSLRSLLVSG